MILTEDKLKREQNDHNDYCTCEKYSKIYKPVTSNTVFPARVYEKVKLEPLEVKLEPISCNTCSTTLYTHNTDEVQLVGGEVAVPPVPWTSHSTTVLMDHLARSVKVCHLPCNVHQESLRGVMSMGGPVITLQYIHQQGQHMQFWVCEYQSENDVPIACKKLNSFRCHGVYLQVKPALQNKKQLKSLLELHEDVIKPTSLVCQICKMKYETSEDLFTHLYINHHVHPVTKPVLVTSGKLSKERKFSKLSEAELATQKVPEFNDKEWVEKRPTRNPDYKAPNDYVLDMVIGVKDDKNKLGFVPVDHMYAKVPEIVRGMIPNSVLNGADAITFHPSMVTLIQQKDDQLRYTPVEHSYSKINPKCLWCSVCGRKYNSEELLNAHLPVHFKKKSERTKEENESMSRKRKLKRAPKDESFTCKMCSSKFKSKSTFIAHVTAHELDEEMEVEPKIVTHKCQHCDLPFPNEIKMIKHQLLHECEKCSETFTCLSEAQSHRDSHILLEKAKCLCEICGKKFMAPKEFLHHLISTNHPITKQARQILSIPKTALFYQDFKLLCRKGDYNCLKCSKTCETDIELYSHMGFHFVYESMPSPYRIEKEAQSVIVKVSPGKATTSTDHARPPIKMKIQLSTILSDISPQKETCASVKHGSFESAVEVDTSNKYACTICKKVLTSKKSLKGHMNHHKEELLREAEMEEKIDSDKEAKNKIEQIQKPKIEKFRCIRCIMSFDSEQKLKIHIDAFHEINADDLRDEITTTKPSVKIGKAKKSAVKLYRCDDCDKRFAHDFALKAHKETEHVEIVKKARQTCLEDVLRDAKPLAVTVDETQNHVSLKELLKDSTPKMSESSDNDQESHNTEKHSTLNDILADHENDSDSIESLTTPLRKRARAVARMMKSPPSHAESGIVRARKTAAKLFKCKICDIRFGSKRILSFHKQQHAEGKIKPPSQVPVNKDMLDPERPKGDFKYPSNHKSSSAGPLISVLNDHIVPEAVCDKDALIEGEGEKVDEQNGEILRVTVHKSRKVAKKTIIKKVFQCDICEEPFVNRAEYIAHIKSHTNDVVDTSSVSNSVDDVEPEDEIIHTPDDIEQECMIPTAQLTDRANIMPSPSNFAQNETTYSLFEDNAQELDKCQDIQVQSDFGIVNNPNVKQQFPFNHQTMHIEETKQCNICQKQFLAWSTICAHMGTHPGASYSDVTIDWKSKFNPLFPCFICGEKHHVVAHCYLHYKCHVNNKQENLESGDVGGKCTICGVKYDKVGSLHTHLKMHVPRVGFEDPFMQKITDKTHFLCKTCHRVVTPKSRRRHNEIHDEPLNHICEICEDEFPNQRQYIQHYYHNHFHDFDVKLKTTASANLNGRQGSGPSITENTRQPASTPDGGDIQCQYCRSTFLSLKSRRNHEYKHRKGVFKTPCLKCNIFFQSREELLYHLDKEGHVQGPTAVPCSKCELKFLSNPSRLYHEKMVHNIQIELPEFDSTQQSDNIDPIIAASNAFNQSPKSKHGGYLQNCTTTPAQHKNHHRSYYPLEHAAKDLGIHQEQSQILGNKKHHSEMIRHICQFCKTSYSTLNELHAHLETEHVFSQKENDEHNTTDYEVELKKNKNQEKDVEEFYCTICELTFNSYSERWLHEEESEKVGNFRCMDCGFDYKTKHQRIKHHCNAHHSIKTAVTSSSKQNNVDRNGLSIIGFSNRKCHACNRLFEDKESFKYHVRKHWYRCFSCHYDFCSKKSMRAHLKLQKCFHPNVNELDNVFDDVLIECLLCNEVMSITDHIAIHFLDHTIKENGKYDMFLCLMCGAPYKIIDQLRHHMKTEAFFMLKRMFPKLKSLSQNNVSTELKLENFATRDNKKFFAGEPETLTTINFWGCPFCNNKYNNYKTAWSHIRSYHKSVGKPFKLDKIDSNCSDEPNVTNGDEKEDNNSFEHKQNTGPKSTSEKNEPDTHTITDNDSNDSDKKHKSAELDKARQLLNDLLNKSCPVPANCPGAHEHANSATNHSNQHLLSPPSATKALLPVQRARPRQESDSSTSHSSATNKVSKSPVTDYNAAKTAGLIAKMLRGPDNSSALLPTPPLAAKPVSTRASTPLYRQAESPVVRGINPRVRCNTESHNRFSAENDLDPLEPGVDLKDDHIYWSSGNDIYPEESPYIRKNIASHSKHSAFYSNQSDPPFMRHSIASHSQHSASNNINQSDPPFVRHVVASHSQHSVPNNTDKTDPPFMRRNVNKHSERLAANNIAQRPPYIPETHKNNVRQQRPYADQHHQPKRMRFEAPRSQWQEYHNDYDSPFDPEDSSPEYYRNDDVYQYDNDYDDTIRYNHAARHNAAVRYEEDSYRREAPRPLNTYSEVYQYDNDYRPEQSTVHHYANDYDYPVARSDDIAGRSELSSRPPIPYMKSEVHKCRYCQRIFRTYINVYNHLIRAHADDIPRNGPLRPISRFDGRASVWSLEDS